MNRYDRAEGACHVHRPLGFGSVEVGCIKGNSGCQSEHCAQGIENQHDLDLVLGLGPVPPAGLLVHKPLTTLPAVGIRILFCGAAVRTKHNPPLMSRKPEIQYYEVKSYMLPGLVSTSERRPGYRA